MAREAKPPNTEKELPIPRPGTSGTEALRWNRKQASNAFQRAQRAEQAYLARKRATAARDGLVECREHFKESRKHFAAGTMLFWRWMTALPSMGREKRESWREGKELKRRETLRRERERWERLAKAEEDATRIMGDTTDEED
jgi:hypothetical protein